MFDPRTDPPGDVLQIFEPVAGSDLLKLLDTIGDRFGCLKNYSGSKQSYLVHFLYPVQSLVKLFPPSPSAFRSLVHSAAPMAHGPSGAFCSFFLPSDLLSICWTLCASACRSILVRWILEPWGVLAVRLSLPVYVVDYHSVGAQVALVQACLTKGCDYPLLIVLASVSEEEEEQERKDLHHRMLDRSLGLPSCGCMITLSIFTRGGSLSRRRSE